MVTEPLIFQDVLVLHTTGLGWLCRIGNVQLFLAKLDVATRPMPAENQTGTVAIAAPAVDRVRQLLRTR